MTTNLQDDSTLPAEAVAQRLLLTVSDAAQQLGVGRSLLYELLAEGQVDPRRPAPPHPHRRLAAYIARQRARKPGVAGTVTHVALGAHPRRNHV